MSALANQQLFSLVFRTAILFALVGPLVGALMLAVETVLLGTFNPHYYVPFSRWPEVVWQSLFMGIQVGAVPSFLCGLVFGLIAAMLQMRHVWIALAVALMPLPTLPLLLPGVLGGSIWEAGAFWIIHVVIYVIVCVTICWLVWRRVVDRAS